MKQQMKYIFFWCLRNNDNSVNYQYKSRSPLNESPQTHLSRYNRGPKRCLKKQMTFQNIWYRLEEICEQIFQIIKLWQTKLTVALHNFIYKWLSPLTFLLFQWIRQSCGLVPCRRHIWVPGLMAGKRPAFLCCSQETCQQAGSLEPGTSGRTGGHVAQHPLDRPAHGDAGDERSCQPSAAGLSGHGVGERFWHCTRKVCKTYPYLWGCDDAGAKSMSLTLGARKLNSSDGWVKSLSV